MKKGFRSGGRIALLLCAAVAVLPCAGCSSQVQGYSARYNTAANLEAFQSGSLFSLAQELCRNRNRVSVSEQSTTPGTPFLAGGLFLPGEAPAGHPCPGGL